MYIVTLFNKETHDIFEKKFDSYYLLNKFKNRVKRSKKLILLAEWKEM